MAKAKKHEVSTLVNKSMKELVKLRNKLRQELYDLNLKNSLKALNQTHLIKLTRKNIARVNTAMKQKQLAKEQEEA